MTIIDQARAILHANDRGGYTVPTDRLYPFQWNWDSAFVAMGFATWDVDRALSELERLVQGQWADGMIPHIVFHQPADTYFPGPDVWRTSHRIATSGISQPPVFGYALAFIAERAEPRHEPRIAALFRAALANLRWWRRARDPEGRGLIAILHNWETGRDNSPEWDRPFARVPETTVTPVRRRDTGHVDAAMRPTDADYRRYIHLVDAYAAAGWEPQRMWEVAPFKIADIGVNALFVASAQALRRLALVHGEAGDADWLAAAASTQLPWSEGAGCFVSIDLTDGAPIEVATSAGFLPLLVNATTPAQAARLADRARRCSGAASCPCRRPCPTSEATSRSATGADRFGRW